MRMDDWDDAGRQPAFGHQVDWLGATLEAFDSSDRAMTVNSLEQTPGALNQFSVWAVFCRKFALRETTFGQADLIMIGSLSCGFSIRNDAFASLSPHWSAVIAA